MYTCNIYYESIWPDILGHIKTVMCCKISVMVADDSSRQQRGRHAPLLTYVEKSTCT